MPGKVLKTLSEQVTPAHTALIVIDPQGDFVGANGYAAAHLGWDVSRMQAAMRRLSNFILKAREARVTVVWVRTIFAKDMLTPNVRSLRLRLGALRQIPPGKSLRPKFLKEGTYGAKWWSEMTEPLPTEYVITKWNYDAFEDTNLDLLLRSTGIKTLLITGVQANVCCETTLRHAFVKGYYAILVSDCTETLSHQEYKATILNVRKYFGLVIPSGKLLETWGLIRSKE